MIVGMETEKRKSNFKVSQYEGSATLERAIAIAAAAHEGAVDKADSPYILHPLRVMLKQATDEERMVAVLHDVVEDTSVTMEDLRDRALFPAAVLLALGLVTKREETAGGSVETYEEFIERCATDPIATAVKLADLEDNLDTLRLTDFDDAAAARFRKYLAAHRRLSGKGKESD